MMETFVQWATILSPIIAVGLAWWTSRSGARDTAKLVKSIKKLTKVQVQLTMLQFHKEFEEDFAHSHILYEKAIKLYGHQFSHFMSEQQLHQEDKKETIEHEQNFYNKKIEVMSQMFKYLEEINNSVDKI